MAKTETPMIARPQSQPGMAYSVLESAVAYMIFEIPAFCIAELFLKRPLTELILPFILLLIPAIIFGPLVRYADRYAEKPRTRSLLIAFAFFVFAVLFIMALVYSAVRLHLIAFSLSSAWLLYFLAGSSLASIGVYYQLCKRSKPRNSTNDT